MPLNTDQTNSGSFPFEVPGGWLTEEIQLDSQSFTLLKPAHPDTILDAPSTLAANEEEVYIPYWATLWPASVQMAKSVLNEIWQPEQRALELGCGLGLVGLAACSAGLKVTFSDYRPEAVKLANWNAELNGFTETNSLQLDWNSPPVDLKVDVILGCDLLYETGFHDSILNAVNHLLLPGGTCWLADPGRRDADNFYQRAKQTGLKIERLNRDLAEQGDHKIGQFQIFRLTQPL